MKIEVGDYVASEFTDHGKVLFIGKEWIVYENDKGVEFCNHKDDCEFWITAEIEWTQ